MFAFTVVGANNPVSTRQTDPFSQIEAYNTLGSLVASYQSTGPVLFTTLPAVAPGQLQLSNGELGAAAFYTFTYTTINPMYPGTTFTLKVPANVGLPAAFTTCNMVFQAVTFPLGWLVINHTVNLTTGMTVPIPPGSKVTLVLGPFTNPVSQQPTPESFVITTFTNNSWRYTIDTVNSSLVPQFKCAYPCATCPSAAQPTACLSCLDNLYLNGTSCLSTCPAQTTPNSHRVCLSIQTRYLDVSSYVTSAQPVYYSFVLTPTGPIPINSSVLITFPPQVPLMAGETAVTCNTTAYVSPWEKYLNHGVTTLKTSSPTVTLNVSNVFEHQVTFGTGSIITLRCGNFKSPI